MIDTDIGPASVMVGNIVQGNRLAAAQGRELRFGDDEANPANKVTRHRLSAASDWLCLIAFNHASSAHQALTRFSLRFTGLFTDAVCNKTYFLHCFAWDS